MFYTSKRLVIDRVFHDKEHWGKLQKSVLDVCFHYMSDEIVTAQSNIFFNTWTGFANATIFEKSLQLNLSQVLSHLSQSKPVKLIANVLTIFNTVLSLCRDQPINLYYKLMRWFLYNGLLPQGFKNLCKSLEGWGGRKIHNMTWLIALKSFLNVSDNPQINVLASALFYSIAIIRGSL